MYQIIYESLSRQERGLALLRDLLLEEYEILLGRDTNAVVALEFSIQELIRQLAVEKDLVIRSLKGQRVLAYAETLETEKGEILKKLFREVDSSEQAVSRQASHNAQLSLALLDQSTHTLKALTSQVVKPMAGVYSRNGGLRHELHPQAALISGRL